MSDYRTERVEAEDGFPLGVRVFGPDDARGIVIIHGATAVPQTYYERFAAFAARAGLRVVTYDYRGVGFSRPSSLRGFEATMTDWARLDARAVQRHYSENDRTVIVGHSFGGQMIGLVDELADVAGAILVGSQLGYVGDWPLWSQPKLRFFFHLLIPGLSSTLGYLPGAAGLGTDLPAGVAREWASWCTSPGYLRDLHADAAARFAAFDRPVLAYSFTDDDYAPRATVERLIGALVRARVTHRRMKGPVGHFGFFRSRFESTLWPEAVSTIDRLLEGEGVAPGLATGWRLDLGDLESDLRHRALT
jgi:predicted alpha/beta hydrolase